MGLISGLEAIFQSDFFAFCCHAIHSAESNVVWRMVYRMFFMGFKICVPFYKYTKI